MSEKSNVFKGRYVSPFEGYLDADGVQVASGQDDRGRELPDPVPVAPPVGYRPPPPLADMIRRMVQSELLAQAADSMEIDTAEEADDFDIEDDPVDVRTPWEEAFDLASQFTPEGRLKPLSQSDGENHVPSASSAPAAPPGSTGADSGEGTGNPNPEGAGSPP